MAKQLLGIIAKKYVKLHIFVQFVALGKKIPLGNYILFAFFCQIRKSVTRFGLIIFFVYR